MTDHLSEVPFGDQQPGANPALVLIACPTSFRWKLPDLPRGTIFSDPQGAGRTTACAAPRFDSNHERYVGCKRKLRGAVNGRVGIEPESRE